MSAGSRRIVWSYEKRSDIQVCRCLALMPRPTLRRTIGLIEDMVVTVDLDEEVNRGIWEKNKGFSPGSHGAGPNYLRSE